MKKKALMKNTIREIRGTPGRFFSIVFMLSLGAFMFAGLFSTGPKMIYTADVFTEKVNMEDLNIHSTFGLDDDDVAIIDKAVGRYGGETEYTYATDLKISGTGTLITVSSISDHLSLYSVIEGRMPEKADEIAMDAYVKNLDIQIGDIINFDQEENKYRIKDDGKHHLKNYSYKVVGLVESADFLGVGEKGHSKSGLGLLDGFGVIIKDNFDLDAYTTAKIKYDDTVNFKTQDSQYEKIIAERKSEIQKLMAHRPEEKLADLKANVEEDMRKGEEDIAEAKQEIADAEKKLNDTEIELKDGEEKLIDAENTLQAEEAKGLKEIRDAETELEEARAKLNNAKSILALKRLELEIYRKKLEDGQVEDEDGWKKYEDGIRALEAEEAALAQEEANYQEGVKKLADAKEIFNKEMADAKAEIQANRVALEEGWEKYEEGKKAFDEESQKVLAEIANVEKEIAYARNGMSKLQAPIYNIDSRSDNYMYYMYYDAAKRLNFMSYVVPVFFYLIALLVSLTTMTRMVNERRGQIGILKALGYSDFDIMKKYLIYAGLSSLIGGTVGGIAGEIFPPDLIAKAYGGVFVINQLEEIRMTGFVLASILTGFILNTLATVYVTSKLLKEQSATLMRPRAPRLSSRIFLEKIKPVWHRLSFMKKVTARNMFRYKTRMFMTIFGVAGCSGLIMFGFALKDAVGMVTTVQKGEIANYELLVIYDENISQSSVEAYKDILKTDPGIEGYSTGHFEILDWENEVDFNDAIYLVVPKDVEHFKNFYYLDDLSDRGNIDLNDGQIVISDKLAKIMDISPGDTITLMDEHHKKIDMKISAISRNYIFHYVFMNEATYNEVFGKETVYNSDMVALKNKSEESVGEVKDSFMDIKSVIGMIDMDISYVNDVLAALNLIILAIIILSSGLAFVVLYNLNNINIAERERELSTLKVLGFYPRETTEYVYRETVALSFIGIVFGLVFSRFLLSIMLEVVVPSSVKLYEGVRITSYLYATLITIVFSLVVMYFVHRKIRQIDMVEALKDYD